MPIARLPEAPLLPTPMPASPEVGPARVLSVQASAQRYAIALQTVQELREMGPLRGIPGAPTALLGLLELRGDVLPVFCLSHLVAQTPGANQVVVVVDLDGRRIGLAVDGVHDVLPVDPQAWRAMPGMRQRTPFDALVTLADGLLPLISLSRLLSPVAASASSFAH